MHRWGRIEVIADIMLVLGTSWLPLDNADKLKKEAYLSGVRVEGLRKLTPGMGAYVNEVSLQPELAYDNAIDLIQAYPYEPDWQHTFWGTNYERLLAIKKKFDPQDVLWCFPCVGNEGWHMVDDMLCRV